MLPYVSPEQTGRLNRSVDHRTDLYSLGVILYELLTGQRPFVEGDGWALLHAHLAKSPVPPHHIVGAPLAGALFGRRAVKFSARPERAMSY
jgi:serine/threonine protein kinase